MSRYTPRAGNHGSTSAPTLACGLATDPSRRNTPRSTGGSSVRHAAGASQRRAERLERLEPFEVGEQVRHHVVDVVVALRRSPPARRGTPASTPVAVMRATTRAGTARVGGRACATRGTRHPDPPGDEPTSTRRSWTRRYARWRARPGRRRTAFPAAVPWPLWRESCGSSPRRQPCRVWTRRSTKTDWPRWKRASSCSRTSSRCSSCSTAGARPSTRAKARPRRGSGPTTACWSRRSRTSTGPRGSRPWSRATASRRSSIRGARTSRRSR